MQNPRLRLQWIVLSGLPCAPGAPSVEQIRFALLHNRITKTRPRSPATAINLFYFTMTDYESQTDARKAT
jgi:hypothetical protein